MFRKIRRILTVVIVVAAIGGIGHYSLQSFTSEANKIKDEIVSSILEKKDAEINTDDLDEEEQEVAKLQKELFGMLSEEKVREFADNLNIGNFISYIKDGVDELPINFEGLVDDENVEKVKEILGKLNKLQENAE